MEQKGIIERFLRWRFTWALLLPSAVWLGMVIYGLVEANGVVAPVIWIGLIALAGLPFVLAVISGPIMAGLGFISLLPSGVDYLFTLVVPISIVLIALYVLFIVYLEKMSKVQLWIFSIIIILVYFALIRGLFIVGSQPMMFP